MLCHHTGDRPLIHHCPDDHLYLVLPEFPCAVFVKGRFLGRIGTDFTFLGLFGMALPASCTDSYSIHRPEHVGNKDTHYPTCGPVVVIVQP